MPLKRAVVVASCFPDRLPGWCEPPIMCSFLFCVQQPVRRAPDSAWQHDMYDNFAPVVPAGSRGMGGGIETGTKLYISNLDYGVSNDDIKVNLPSLLLAEAQNVARFSLCCF